MPPCGVGTGHSPSRARAPRRTTMCAMSAPTGSPSHLFVVHRPRRHRRARPRRGDRVLPRRLRHAAAAPGDQRGAGRPRGDGRRSATPARASSCWRPARRDSHDREVPRPVRARASSSSPTGSPTSSRSRAVLRERGLRLLYDEPRRGTADSRINFVHPKDAGGVLVELVEPAATAHGEPGPAEAVTRGLTPVTRRYDSRRPRRRSTREADPRRHPRRRHRPRRSSPPSTLPESYRARDRAQGRGATCSRASTPATRTRASRLHVDDVAAPGARPGRGAGRGDGQRDQLQHRLDLDLRAGVRRSASSSATAGSRRWPSGTTCPTTWSAPTSPASCCATGPGVHAWQPGDEVVAHCLSVELESPDGHNDTMLDPEQRIWGFETNFGGLAEHRPGQVQPADAEAGAPDLGGGGQPRAGELHRLPPAGLPQRRRHEAGRQRADLGRQRRPRRRTPPSSR